MDDRRTARVPVRAGTEDVDPDLGEAIGKAVGAGPEVAGLKRASVSRVSNPCRQCQTFAGRQHGLKTRDTRGSPRVTSSVSVAINRHAVRRQMELSPVPGMLVDGGRQFPLFERFLRPGNAGFSGTWTG